MILDMPLEREREDYSQPEEEDKVFVDGVWMTRETMEADSRMQRAHELQREEDKRQVSEAKEKGTKELLDVEKFIREYGQELSEATYKKLLEDKEVIDEIEIDYYLNTPEEVNDLSSYMRWRSENDG